MHQSYHRTRIFFVIKQDLEVYKHPSFSQHDHETFRRGSGIQS